MKSFIELFKINLKVIYRFPQSLFWIIVMPVGFYVVISLFHIEKFINLGTTYSNFLLPGIIALTVMQNGLYGLAYWLVDLRGQGVIKRFTVTPIKPLTLVLSVVCARTLISLMQATILTLIGVIFFHADFYPNLISILLLIILGSIVFLLIGLLISTFAKSYDAAAPITTMVGLPMTFLGGAFYPAENFPKILEILVHILPLTFFSRSLRFIYLHPFSFQVVWRDYVILLIWLIALLFIVAKRFRIEE